MILLYNNTVSFIQSQTEYSSITIATYFVHVELPEFRRLKLQIEEPGVSWPMYETAFPAVLGPLSISKSSFGSAKSSSKSVSTRLPATGLLITSSEWITLEKNHIISIEFRILSSR